MSRMTFFEVTMRLLAENIADELEGHLTNLSGPASQERIEAAEKELGVEFPVSYRTFLEAYGTGRLGYVDIFGLPSDWLWGDIVLMNELSPVKAPENCLLVARDVRGNFYYLNTFQGEDSPVFRLTLDGKTKFAAQSFMSFLRLVKDDRV